ncbi:ABC transporter related protein [Nostocoides australiense Ben110]|uniref:ABC transporter related protein n=1 Tax=Nostocoides australiense Ben110 TaxID=1193182 RepID=W6JUH6_9MICO|nr:ATP-binding cassette domain-containing protein [Tetrasphaera australiensis]CCH72201.1 ABC transporter related protein [Tetrasphaera australiensis Ben110]
MSPVIEVTDAAFGYAGQPVVSHVTFRLDPGEVVAVLGPNGSGKSTLIKGLVGLTEELGGTTTILGQPLAQAERGLVGYVPQRHTLGTSVRASVAEIVGTGRVAFMSMWRPWARNPARSRQAVARALDLVGLGDRADADVSALSGGQQRRVLIARALATSPEVLIMDEPTAGVDHGNQLVLAGVLERLKARGTTMLIVTHELDALATVVDRVVVIEDGRLTYDGPADSLPPGGTRGHHHDHDDEDTGESAGAPVIPTARIDLGGPRA